MSDRPTPDRPAVGENDRTIIDKPTESVFHALFLLAQRGFLEKERILFTPYRQSLSGSHGHRPWVWKVLRRAVLRGNPFAISLRHD